MRSTVTLFAFALATAAHAQPSQRVPVAAFNNVELRGGGSVIVRPGPAQHVTLLSGSTRFTSFTVDRNGRLRIDACNAQCPRNYDLRIEVQSPRVPGLAVTAGGAIRVVDGFGPQREAAAAVNGGGTIDLRRLRATSVSAAVNGGGQILSGPSATLSAAVNGGGEVRYAGNPRISSAIQGGGSVTRGN